MEAATKQMAVVKHALNQHENKPVLATPEAPLLDHLVPAAVAADGAVSRILSRMAVYLQQREPNARPEWIKNLPLTARRLKSELYRGAATLAEYSNADTLFTQVSQLARILGDEAQPAELHGSQDEGAAAHSAAAAAAAPMAAAAGGTCEPACGNGSRAPLVCASPKTHNKGQQLAAQAADAVAAAAGGLAVNASMTTGCGGAANAEVEGSAEGMAAGDAAAAAAHCGGGGGGSSGAQSPKYTQQQRVPALQQQQQRLLLMWHAIMCTAEADKCQVSQGSRQQQGEAATALGAVAFSGVAAAAARVQEQTEDCAGDSDSYAGESDSDSNGSSPAAAALHRAHRGNTQGGQRTMLATAAAAVTGQLAAHRANFRHLRSTTPSLPLLPRMTSSRQAAAADGMSAAPAFNLAQVTGGWQSANDAPHRWRIMAHIVDSIPGAQELKQNATLELLKQLRECCEGLELSLYRSAASFAEYSNTDTLFARMQALGGSGASAITAPQPQPQSSRQAAAADGASAAAAAAQVTGRWRSANDAPHPRRIIAHIVDSIPGAQELGQNAPPEMLEHLRQCSEGLELALYRSAASLTEYSNTDTLFARMQALGGSGASAITAPQPQPQSSCQAAAADGASAAAAAAQLTGRWRSANDAPHPRRIIAHIVDSIPGAQELGQNAPPEMLEHLRQCSEGLELALYRSAASLTEYSNTDTLFARMQALGGSGASAITAPQPQPQSSRQAAAADGASAAAAAAQVTGRWQSADDALHRRRMLAHIVTDMMERLPEQAERLELSLYCSAASFAEYNRTGTLRRRIQALHRRERREARAQGPGPKAARAAARSAFKLCDALTDLPAAGAARCGLPQMGGMQGRTGNHAGDNDSGSDKDGPPRAAPAPAAAEETAAAAPHSSGRTDAAAHDLSEWCIAAAAGGSSGGGSADRRRRQKRSGRQARRSGSGGESGGDNLTCNQVVEAGICVDAANDMGFVDRDYQHCPICRTAWSELADSLAVVLQCGHAACLCCLTSQWRASREALDSEEEDDGARMRFCCALCHAPLSRQLPSNLAKELLRTGALTSGLTMLASRLQVRHRGEGDDGARNLQCLLLVEKLLSTHNFDIAKVQNVLFEMVGLVSYDPRTRDLGTEDKQAIYERARRPVRALQQDLRKAEAQAAAAATDAQHAAALRRRAAVSARLEEARVNAAADIYASMNAAGRMGVATSAATGRGSSGGGGASDIAYVDLHGLTPEEACRIVSEFVAPIAGVLIGGGGGVVLVTGRGAHSAVPGQCALRESVKAHLAEINLAWEPVPGNAGALQLRQLRQT
ncbi:hypothetical protein JKP88DRAFT_285427 [Tribonema minus]|uniref:Smr domain-containing protein n=1 Tax=Tribonema minus TaxID=303371 RepID=A0A835ZCM4_9STRA|nr:hypothetical protein JKP88DRAFT_285427 [Tribonema minus]